MLVHPLVLDGQLLEIRDNVWILLFQLRKDQGSTYFWANAVYVSQAGVEKENVSDFSHGAALQPGF
jgi:hypothetical protein